MSDTFSVVICAYTLDRWTLLVESVESAQAQTLPPLEVIVCIDHNRELADRARSYWCGETNVRVVENRFPGRLGSARNTALEVVSGDIVAFLDDDAAAARDWLWRLAEIYTAEPMVQGVGGCPVPRFEVPRPAWFPFEFDWVFGCGYAGLPSARTHIGRLIGACMSVRTEAALAVAGFHSDNHDDMDLSHRLLDRFGVGSVIYDPAIQVTHFVSSERVTWKYFWRRCFHVNRGKVLAFSDMAEAGNLQADLAFVRHALFSAVPRYVYAAKSGGRRRAVAMLAGIALAGLGNLVGRVSRLIGLTAPALTQGLESTPRSVASSGTP